MATTFRMADGDLYFDVNGRLEQIRDFDKVSQDIAEVLMTDLDVDRLYGSELPLVTSGPVVNVSEAQVTTLVADAIERLRGFQATNLTTSLAEEIMSITQIQVFKNDQTEVTFGVEVTTSAGGTISSAAAFAPKPVALNHILPPSKTQQIEEFRRQAQGKGAIITGEKTNGS